MTYSQGNRKGNTEISEIKGRGNEHKKIWYNSTSIYDNKLIIQGTICSWEKHQQDTCS